MDDIIRDVITNPLPKHNRGDLCERIAFLKFSKRYPSPEYEIYTNSNYASTTLRGELDIFVRKNSKVLVVLEVKCWDDQESAKKKARDQLNRFKRHIDNLKLNYKWGLPCRVEFWKGVSQLHFDCSEFSKTLYHFYLPLGDGGRYDLGFSVEELDNILHQAS